MSDRTPTPWRVEEGTSLIWGACTDDPSTYGMGYPIVEAKIPGWRPYKPSMEEREANAAFIVKAVNAHDALVKALQNMLEFCQTQGDFKNGVTHNGIDEGEVWASGVFDEARAALASVTERA